MGTGTFEIPKDQFEIQKYTRSVEADKQESISFYGSPRKHPYDKNRVVLIADPFSTQPFYYEFNIRDIVAAEEQANMTSVDAESISMVRIWVRKGSHAVQCTPFVVNDITRS